MARPLEEPATFMDTHEVASYLRVKERKIYDLVREKRIPCVRVTGKWLFSKMEIDAWLRAGGEGASAARRRAPMVATGSHDPLLEWSLRRLDLAILPGESSSGLARMAAGEAVLAGVHLLDGESGEYNIPQARAALSDADVVLIEWAWRDQGLVVPAGNPLSLTSVVDLATSQARVALRQEGAGARSLFDWLLHKAEIGVADLTTVSSAMNEMEIGLAVLAGTADAGLAVASVARSLRLDFIPLHRERFDLVIDRRAYFEPSVQRLFDLAHSDGFRAKADSLGGYDLSDLGTIRWNAP
jgi:putative molybdopterin biosynthesis protein